MSNNTLFDHVAVAPPTFPLVPSTLVCSVCRTLPISTGRSSNCPLLIGVGPRLKSIGCRLLRNRTSSFCGRLVLTHKAWKQRRGGHVLKKCLCHACLTQLFLARRKWIRRSQVCPVSIFEHSSAFM